MVHRLLGRSLRHRYNRYEGAAFGFGVVLDATIDKMLASRHAAADDSDKGSDADKE